MDGGAPPLNATDARPGLDALLGGIAQYAGICEAWPAPQRAAADARCAAIEALNAEAFRRLIGALKNVPAAAPALRDAVSDEVVYAVLRRHGLLKPSLAERIEMALDTVRPMLAGHGGDVAIVAIEPPAVELRLTGACDGCPASAMTFYAGIRQAIATHVPEITVIRQAKGTAATTAGVRAPGDAVVSPFAGTIEAGWTQALRLEALADRETRVVARGGLSLLVTRFGDGATCFENVCAHFGLAMDGALAAGGRITCPHHGFVYDLATGACLTAGGIGLRRIPARVEAGRVLVQPGG